MSEVHANTYLAADGSQATAPSIPGLKNRMSAAWVNFNGTGVVAIRESFNVSSITDNGIGSYFVNFDTQMPNANYAAVTTQNGTTGSNNITASNTSFTVSGYSLFINRSDGALQDATIVSSVAFAN